jgi:hypothetical protein
VSASLRKSWWKRSKPPLLRATCVTRDAYLASTAAFNHPFLVDISVNVHYPPSQVSLALENIVLGVAIDITASYHRT